MTALDIYREIAAIDAELLRLKAEALRANVDVTSNEPAIERLAKRRSTLFNVLGHIHIDESSVERPKLQLNLWPESWENIFDCIHHKDTRIHSQGNFWAAIQHLEEQSSYHTPERRKALGILEQEEV